jgi:subtilase family serine protease
MSKRKTITVTVALAAAMAGLVIAGTGQAAKATGKPPPRILAGSAVPFTASSTVTGTVEGARALTVQLWLRPQAAAAEAFAAAVSVPGNALYGHYMSPSAYTARFGATAAEAAAARSWLRSQGFTGISTGAQRDYVRATATVAQIDAAFKTQLKYYKPSPGVTAGRDRLYANDGPLTLPAALVGTVAGVTGLDNAAPVLPLIQRGATRATAGPAYKCSAYWGQHTATLAYKQDGTTTYPTAVCGYSANQLRAAYGASAANSGQGQTIALVEQGLTPGMFTTLQKYAASNGLPAPSAARYKELGIGNVSYSGCGDPFYIEESLDVEAAYDMAPGANELVVSGDACDIGDGGLQSLFDADLAVLNGNGSHPLASAASNSWGSGDEEQPLNLTRIEHDYLVKAAAEGVGMYFSAGDASGLSEPPADPYAISVGGTTLGIGKAGSRLFETGWSTNSVEDKQGTWTGEGEFLDGATGGGPSLLWAQPGYQKGVVPKALATPPGTRAGGPTRSAPDISADADPATGFLLLLQNLSHSGVVTGYTSESVGGTSISAPLVAAIVTAAQQGQARPFGFINPALYKIGNTAAINDALPLTAKTPVSYRQAACDPYYCGALEVLAFDDQSFAMAGYYGQVTLRGYDNMTGLGTPAGQEFISALRKLLK